MTVTVVVHGRARAGQVDAAAAAAEDLLRDADGWAAPKLDARLFQGLDDPASFLYVAEWESREAHQARMRDVWSPRVAAHFEATAAVYYCQTLAWYENMTRAPGVVSSLIVHGPAAASGALRATALNLAHQSRQLPELLLYRICSDLDDPGRIVAVHGWTSAEVLANLRREFGAAGLALFTAHGATVTRFFGRPRGEFDRPMLERT